jgi:endogenous inhibitor of DNA gyrase (YacG/DUF329 family)
MSGSSYESPCPKCGNGMECYSDHKPFALVSGECLYCGFQYWTEDGQMTLDDVNETRIARGLEPIEKLAQQVRK